MKYYIFDYIHLAEFAMHDCIDVDMDFIDQVLRALEDILSQTSVVFVGFLASRIENQHDISIKCLSKQ